MRELIDRKSLIEALRKDIQEYKDTDGQSIPFKTGMIYRQIEVIKIIEEQPTVESPTWIPCSERMPTEKEAWEYNADENLYEPNEFIVQVKGAKLPTVAMFDGETFIHRYAENGYGFIGEIIAWQPLPPAFKGEQHETD